MHDMNLFIPITTTNPMALLIRSRRALLLTKQLAARKGVTMTRAVVMALESAMARDARRYTKGLPISPVMLRGSVAAGTAASSENARLTTFGATNGLRPRFCP
jgi:hypothetical protein